MPLFEQNPDPQKGEFPPPLPADLPPPLPSAHADRAELKSQLYSLLPLPQNARASRHVDNVIDHHARVLAKVGLVQADRDAIALFGRVFLHDVEIFRGLSFIHRPELAAALTIDKTLTVALSFTASNPDSELFQFADRLLGRLRRESRSARATLIHTLAEVVPHFKKPEQWVAILSSVGTRHVFADIPEIAKDANVWSGAQETKQQRAARTSFIVYCLRNDALSHSQRKQILHTRDRRATGRGDDCRTFLLRLAIGGSGRVTAATMAEDLGVIGKIERRDPAAVAGLADTLESYGNDQHATRSLLRNLLRFPEDSVSFASQLGLLCSERFSTAFFSPNVAAFFAHQLIGIRPSERAALMQVAVATSGFLRSLWDEAPRGIFEHQADRLSVVLGLVENEIRDPRHLAKILLMLEGRNIASEHRVRRISHLINESVQLHVHSAIVTATHVKDLALRKSIETKIASTEYAAGDNPPFSLATTPKPIQKQFMAEVRHGFRRMLDGYYGFWSQTYPMRRLPISGRCYFDEMAWDIGAKLSVVVARDHNRFPGRGRVIEGINPERIFGIAPSDAHRDPFHHWKKELLASLGPIPDAQIQGNRHPIDDLLSTRFLFLRGLRAVSVPDSQIFSIEGEHATYLEYNHHFDPTGVNLGYFVPTRALWSFVNPYLRPYSRGDQFPDMQGQADITESPPTIEQLRERCKQLGTKFGIVHLGSGSNYFGGFCNGFDIKSAPYHEWEIRCDTWHDSFGHSHKYHIKSDSAHLQKLHGVHRRLYEMLIASTNRLDLFKVIDAIYAWGQTNDWTPPQSLDDGWQSANDAEMNLTVGEPNSGGLGELPPMILQDSTDANFLDSEDDPAVPWRERTLRMLQWTAAQMHECRAAKISAEQTPILVMKPAMFQSRALQTPFIIDAHSGIVWRRGQEALIFDRTDGEIPSDIRDWWLENVSPLWYKGNWWVPALVQRHNYYEQLREMGAHQ